MNKISTNQMRKDISKLKLEDYIEITNPIVDSITNKSLNALISKLLISFYNKIFECKDIMFNEIVDDLDNSDIDPNSDYVIPFTKIKAVEGKLLSTEYKTCFEDFGNLISNLIYSFYSYIQEHIDNLIYNNSKPSKSFIFSKKSLTEFAYNNDPSKVEHSYYSSIK